MLALISYASVWPFDFAPVAAQRLPQLWDFRQILLVDALENVAAFVPVGFVLGAAHGLARRWRDSLVAIAVAVLLQIIQLWLPVRSPALYDALFNGIGLLAGLGLAALLHALRRLRGAPPPLDVVLILLALAAPMGTLFVTHGHGGVMDVWRLRTDEAVAGQGTLLLQALALGAALAGILRRYRTLALVTSALLALAVAAASFDLAVPRSLAVIAGATLILWLPRPWQKKAAIAAIAAALLMDGLTPWIIASQQLVLTPLRSMILHPTLPLFITLASKSFLWSALALLMFAQWQSGRWAVAVTALVVLGIELAQTRIASGTPELTDPLLATLFAALVVLVQQQSTPGSRRA